MNSKASSPAPKPRGGRNHRHTKSGSAINTPVSLPPKNTASQPRNLPHHNTAHHLQNPPPRGRTNEPTHDTRQEGPGSKKKRNRRKPKDLPKSSPTRDDKITASANINLPPTPNRPTYKNEVMTPPSPTMTPGRVYAGPTFHHSPAPASLPAPKFFSKSVPAPRAPGLQAMMEESCEDLQTSPPENHLEKLFQADREQRAMRKVRGEDNSDNESSGSSNRDVFSMEPMSPTRPIFKSPQSAVRPNANRSVTEPVFSMDFDSSPKPPSPSRTAPPRENGEQEKSAALLQFLLQSPVSMDKFNAKPYSNASPSPPPRAPLSFRAGSPHNQRSNNVNTNRSPVPQRRLNYTINNVEAPHTPPKKFTRIPYNSQPHVSNNLPISARQLPRILFDKNEAAPSPCAKDITDMENNLRRMLKIDAHESTRHGGVLIG
ncbi:hypothetical protein EDC01DRAFT_497645 [Geopyxis carbonaria]|nr:hypothetical protein EDC01DRAFT_497645 [Geopyxis carbonaria]